MQRSTGYVNTHSGRLHYEVAGSGAPLMLLHGFGLDTRMWDNQVDVFAQHFQVIRYDALGFGRSSLPDGPYSPTTDHLALMDHLGIERAHILGLSRGGGIAIDFALTYPARSLSLILVDSTLNGHRWGAAGEDWAKVWALGKTAPLAEVRAHWLGLPMFGPAMEQPVVAADLWQMIDDYSGWHWQNRDEGQAVKPPAAQRLAEIAAPTLIIVGERDLPDFRHVADLLAGNIPGARLVVLPGAGHMSNMEDPVAFNQAVLSFLGRSATALEQ